MEGFDWRARLREGIVIPAHPLALTAARRLDERRQRALTRYYMDAGAGAEPPIPIAPPAAAGVFAALARIPPPPRGIVRISVLSAWMSAR